MTTLLEGTLEDVKRQIDELTIPADLQLFVTIESKKILTMKANHNEDKKLSPIELIKRMDAFAEQNATLPILTDSAFDREYLYEERI